MSQTPAEASGGHPVKLKFQPKPPNRRPQEERDRIKKKAEEELRQKLERERKKSIPCRFYWFDNGLGDCKKGDSCDYSHEVMPEWLKRRVERQNPDRCNKYNSWEYSSGKEGRNPKRPKLSTNAEPKERAPDFDEQQVKGGQVRNDQNPSTPKCRYYNTYGGCKKGEDCQYQHIDRRPPPPPLKDKTTWGGLDEERVLRREENIQGNDPDLWNIILDERVRLQRDMEQAKKDGDFDDFHRKELDEIKIDDIKGALSGWQGGSVSSKADGVDHEDHRGDFDEIFASIHKQLPDYLQQAVRDNCVDQIIWKSLNLRTQQLFIGKSFNNLSRYVLKSDPWMTLSLLNSLLDLSDARTEKGKGWYLGVVSAASDPVDEDYLGLYVGQSAQIARRVQHHLQDRYTRESFQYQTTRRSDKRVQYVTLGVIPAEGLEHETQRVLLNYGELLLCLFFQTLPQMQLARYLPQEAIREPWIGLNCQNPMQQGIRGRLSQAPDSAWASKDVPEAVRAKRQENMSTIYYLQYVMGKREAFGTYIWARDADLRYEDDPSVLVQCGRCRGQPRRDLAPLYARDGSGYILRQGRCNDCRSLGKEIARLPRFYPIDPRVPYIQMYRLKAEYMRSHPELKVADIECENAEVFTNEELDEAKQIYRESLDEELEDVYLQNANWEDEEQEDVEQEVAGCERRGSYGTREFGGDLRERLLTNQSVHCHKTTTGLKKPRIWVRELHINLPDATDVREEIRVWCDLRPEGSEHPKACAINIEYGDPARRLGIQVTYFDVGTKSKELIWCHVGGEKNTKKLNSLVDFLLGETEDYTESQPRRFLARNKARGIFRSEYTS